MLNFYMKINFILKNFYQSSSQHEVLSILIEIKVFLLFIHFRTNQTSVKGESIFNQIFL